jgi:lipoprotein-releasing system ATP-binding protein
MNKELIKIINLKKHYGNQKAIDGASVNIIQGEEYSIVGASGSGKSTLLYMLGGLERQTSGEIIVDGKNLKNLDDESLAKYRHDYVGFIFQFHFLLPSMNALDNILLPANLSSPFSKLEMKKTKDKVLDLAKKLGVDHLLKKYPYELSGGEQQRINIIRAISLNPKLLLCDEPTGSLDSQNSKMVIELLRNLAKENHTTLVLVTHDLEIAKSFNNQLIMKDGNFIRA